MVTRILEQADVQEYLKVNQITNMILCTSLMGTVNYNAPSQRKKYWSIKTPFAIAEPVFEDLDELIEGFVPVLMLVPRTDEAFETVHQRVVKSLEKKGEKNNESQEN